MKAGTLLVTCQEEDYSLPTLCHFFRRELNLGQQVRPRACALKSLPKTIIMQPCIFHGVAQDGML